MKLGRVLFLLAVPAVTADHPIKSVIDLLKGLKAKVYEEGQAEQVIFNKFAKWCKTSDKTLVDSIEENRVTASRTKNAAASKDAESTELKKMMDRLDAEIAEHDANTKSLNDQRDAEKALYDEAKADFDGTIKALDDGITALQGSKDDAKKTSNAENGVSLLLTHPMLLEEMTDEQQTMLLEVSRQVPDTKQGKADMKKMMNKKQYEFKSDKVVQMLKDMKADFQAKMKAATAAEDEAKRKHANAVEDVKKAKTAAGASKAEKNAMKGEADKKSAELKTEMSTASDNKAADEKTLEDTRANCKRKEKEWEARKDARYGEEKAIKAAIEILAKVGGVSTEVPESNAKDAELLQMEKQGNNARSMLVDLLRKQAGESPDASALLEEFANTVERGSDDTGKELVASVTKQKYKIQKEQEMEDKKKQWCDKEIDKSKADVKEKNAAIEDFDATLVEKQASVDKLTTAINEAKTKIAELTTAMEEATEIRKEDKAENRVAIQDAKKAAAAVTEAIGVLTQFYEGAEANKGATHSSFIQGVELPDNPDTWDAGYSGVADADKQPGGVVAVLKKTLEDFTKMQADTEAQEDEDQAAYEKTLQENKVEKARLETQVELQSEEKTRHKNDLELFKEKKDTTDRELAAVQGYLNQISETCAGYEKPEEGKKGKYEERKAARTEELESLDKVIKVIKEAFHMNFLQTGGFLSKINSH
eukprot:TRINITY_DN683_c0_g1_i1.p1 TRINITY_DN683_c0_g1~~TRINITY_DN683_c0_g1_i1.p1  ORF type:complete len:706 (-),score=255.10 TRINITY_DN683_c0_g1_i1:105-2222(-)